MAEALKVRRLASRPLDADATSKAAVLHAPSYKSILMEREQGATQPVRLLECVLCSQQISSRG